MQGRWFGSWIWTLAMIAAIAAQAADPPAEAKRPRPRVPEFSKNAPPVRSALKDATAEAAAATVRVLCDGKPAALGAVVHPDGYIVTKASLMNGTIVCRMADNREMPAIQIGLDMPSDLAVLYVEATGLPVVSWRTGGAPAPGTIVSATGRGAPPLAVGVVSGPLLAIPRSPAEERQRGWLGIQLGDEDKGVAIDSVLPNSPAEKAGLTAGDRIFKVDARFVATADQVIAAVGGTPPGKVVELQLRRGEKTVHISATLEKAPPQHIPQDNWGGGPYSERRRGFPLVLTTDLTLSPSDCGGPLVDTDGKAVGINIARALRVTSYAVPADEVRRATDPIIAGHRNFHARPK